MKKASHPGFSAVQKKIEGEGYSKRAAGAILAKKTREASPKAKKENPNLKRVVSHDSKTVTGKVKRRVGA